MLSTEQPFLDNIASTILGFDAIAKISRVLGNARNHSRSIILFECLPREALVDQKTSNEPLLQLELPKFVAKATYSTKEYAIARSIIQSQERVSLLQSPIIHIIATKKVADYYIICTEYQEVVGPVSSAHNVFKSIDSTDDLECLADGLWKFSTGLGNAINYSNALDTSKNNSFKTEVKLFRKHSFKTEFRQLRRRTNDTQFELLKGLLSSIQDTLSLRPHLLSHNDISDNNLLLTRNNDKGLRMKLIDFETVSLSPAGTDLGYFAIKWCISSSHKHLFFSLVDRFARVSCVDKKLIMSSAYFSASLMLIRLGISRSDQYSSTFGFLRSLVFACAAADLLEIFHPETCLHVLLPEEWCSHKDKIREFTDKQNSLFAELKSLKKKNRRLKKRLKGTSIKGKYLNLQAFIKNAL